MPIYEYECTRCGRIEEAIQKFSDKPLTKCSHCSGQLHRLISQSSFHLKGGGWYADGYTDKPRKNSKKPEGNKPAEAVSDKPKKATGADAKKTD